MKKNRHKLVERQVRRHLEKAMDKASPEVKASVQALCDAVSDAYFDFERDRSLLERSMELSSQELVAANQKMRDRNAELQRLHVVTQQQQASIVSAAKLSELGKMAGGIAHEINTPLGAILLSAQHLVKLATTQNLPEFVHSLQLITKTVEKIALIIQGMKAFSRDGSGDELQLVSVQKLVQDTTILCGERFRRLAIELTCEIPEKLTVCCRSTQLSQVLLNLLNNSIDAVGPLDKKWVKIQARDLDKDLVEISVTDSGLGIPEAVRENLFHPFFTTKEIGAGAGLGLSISMGMVTENGGNLRLDSNCRNTRFLIVLPKAPSKLVHAA